LFVPYDITATTWRLTRSEAFGIETVDGPRTSSTGSVWVAPGIGISHNPKLPAPVQPPFVHRAPPQRLEYLHVTGGGISNHVAIEIPTEIRQCKSLREISLRRLMPKSILKLFSEPWQTNGDDCSNSCSSLETLRLYGCGLADKHCRKILPNLPASLTIIDVVRNEITSFDGFLQLGLPPRLRKLLLTHNPILESVDPEEQSNLVRLLNTYRYIGWLDRRFSVGRIFDQSNLEILLLNHCGRGLIGDAKPLPLSVWPTVLAKVRRSSLWEMNYSGAEMRAEVLYSLLHGPAFLDSSA
jgi:hypothetical protein